MVKNKPPTLGTICLSVLAACTFAFGEEATTIDSAHSHVSSVADSGETKPELPASAQPDTSKTPKQSVDPRKVAVRKATSPPPSDWHLSLLLDLTDMNAQKRTGQRHFHARPSQKNYCCFDAAWSPVSLWEERFQFGPLINFGGWTQPIEGGPSTTLNDLVVGANLSTHRSTARSGLWARADLGISTLAVTRRTTGVDFGLAAAARVGWNFTFDGYALIVGGGTDTRHYLNLNVKPITAATLFAGVGL